MSTPVSFYSARYLRPIGRATLLSSVLAVLVLIGLNSHPTQAKPGDWPTSRAVLTASVTPTVPGTPSATLTPGPPPPCPGWRIAQSGLTPQLSSVVAIRADDVWTLGYDIGNQQGYSQHWDGSTWTVVPMATVVASPSAVVPWEPVALAAAGPADVWAVGYYVDPVLQTGRTLTQHWDGTAWNMVPSPNDGTNSNRLNAVAVGGPADVWAVGSVQVDINTVQTLIEHWDGTAWTIFTHPRLTSIGSGFSAAAAAGPQDVWAVGDSSTEHWDGTAWTVIPVPTSPTLDLSAVTVISTTDAWAAGGIYATTQAEVLHWDGSTWNFVTLPNPSNLYNWQRAGVVGASGSDDVWVVGIYQHAPDFTLQIVTEHWDGTLWTAQSVLDDSTTDHTVPGIAVLHPQDIWLVGGIQYPVPDSGNSRTTVAPPVGSLIVHYGCTSTPCALPFTDLPANDWAYGYIQWAFCNHIISGYADNTVRPGNPATRGQVTKMITLAAGWPLVNPAVGHFSDVPVGSTFYSYIETGYSHGILSGYANGTFQPGNNITRGQLTKLTVLARGYSLLTPATATFNDVPPGSTFYTYIETAVGQGIIGGYADGSFRPATSATRAQFSKILYGAYASPLTRLLP